jgi:hypothetical protein
VDGTDVDEVLGRVPGQRQPIGATGHSSTAAPPGTITATPAGAQQPNAPPPGPPATPGTSGVPHQSGPPPGRPVGERSPTAGAGGPAVHSPPDAAGPADA